MNMAVELQTALSLRLKERRNCDTSRMTSSSPTIGSLVLTIAVSAAKTGVNERDKACARMMDRQYRPLPRMRFAPPKSSGTILLMFSAATLLTRPVMLFFRESQLIR